jgi:hypothetical protein
MAEEEPKGEGSDEKASDAERTDKPGGGCVADTHECANSMKVGGFSCDYDGLHYLISP